MKIVYLNPDRGIPVLGDKGASVHVRELVTAFSDLGHDVTLLCARLGAGNSPPPARIFEIPPTDPKDESVLQRELARCAYDREFCGRAQTMLAAQPAVPEALYERHTLFHGTGSALAAALGVPRILEVNAPLVEEQEKFRGLSLKTLAEEIETKSFRTADHIIAVSEEIRHHVMTRGVSAERVSVFPNGVDTTRFHTGINGNAIREQYKISADAPVVGFIGSFKPWHGVDFLVEAFVRVAQQRPDATLLAVGDGPALEALRAHIAPNSNGRIIFTGRVSHAQIPLYLAAMDLTVAPYLADGSFYFSPLKVVESLAAGRPVVAPHVGQLSVLLRHGDNGFLFPPGDVAACAATLLEALSNLPRLRAMGRNASTAAQAEFSWRRTAARTISLFTNLQTPAGRQAS